MLLRLAALALAGSFLATAALAEDSISTAPSGPRLTKEVLVAQADRRYVEVCNKSGERIQVARATSARQTNAAGEDLFISEGWWTVNAGDCLRLWDAPLGNRWYYVYAESTRSTWSGKYPFCVRTEKFTIKDTQCQDGYERRYFSRIDMNDEDGPAIYNFTN